MKKPEIRKTISPMVPILMKKIKEDLILAQQWIQETEDLEVDVNNRSKVLLQVHGSKAENLIGYWIEVVRQRNEERGAVQAV